MYYTINANVEGDYNAVRLGYVTGKYNPKVIPTAIVIKDKNLANEIFGFMPECVFFYLHHSEFVIDSEPTPLSRPNSVVNYAR